jgi:hypothetical protein
MKQIPLTRGLVALVDDEDYEAISAYKWSCRGGYASRSETLPGKPGKQRTVYMHRVILGIEFGDSRKVDHKDCDKLNNTRANLRAVTHAQNMQNRRMHSNNTSGAKGVSFVLGYWRAHIRVNGVGILLGCFKNHADAAAAYRNAAVKYHKEFANLG